MDGLGVVIDGIVIVGLTVMVFVMEFTVSGVDALSVIIALYWNELSAVGELTVNEYDSEFATPLALSGA